MFIELDRIKSLEVELSTYCNAACPGCSRHYWGTSTKRSELVEEHLDIDTVTKVIKQIPNINELQIELCGNLGDPLMNPRILDMGGLRC
jgi:MoaA/NifB/PqqE/SkfB family radical SAM enzyme